MLSGVMRSPHRRALLQSHPLTAMATAAVLPATNGTIDITQAWPERYFYVDQVLDNPGPRTDPAFEPGEVVRSTPKAAQK